MKLRQGFVSNSSTSSFVIGKVYMTNEQIVQFRDWIEANESKWSEGYLGETEYYFQGEEGYHWDESTSDILDKIGVDSKYVGGYC